MQIKLLIIILSLSFQSCASRGVENQLSKNPNSYPNETPVNRSYLLVPSHAEKDLEASSPIDSYDLKDSLGWVGTKDKSFAKDESIRIYNEDGSLWYEFSPNHEESARESIEQNENFRPFRYSTDYNLFYFNAVGQDKRYYHVIVNDETGLTKLIRKDDPHIRLGTWEEYILDSFAIEFDANSNPLLQKAEGQPVNHVVRNSINYRPDKIEGDWLKVRWFENNDDRNKPEFGWVRWRKDNRLVLNIFEIA